MENNIAKQCGRCGEVKPLSEFHRKKGEVRGSYCRVCRAAYQKAHYDRYKPIYVRGAKRRKQKLLAEMRALKNKPCADCGMVYPYYVMDFDHREGEEKEGLLSRMPALGWSWKRIEAEIAKCDVVCANCHRERTWQRKKQKKQIEQQLESFPWEDKNSDGQSCQ